MLTSVKTMSQRVHQFFTTTAEDTAKTTSFVRRRSKLTGAVFCQTLVFGLLEQATASLTTLVDFCEDHCGVIITPQGLDDRLQAPSLEFMQSMYTQALALFRQQTRLPVALLTQFSAVNLTDSTAISLPESLANAFPGCGGDASAAGLKVQTVLDFLSGTFQHIWLTPGKEPDQGVRQHLQLAQANSLNLFDLGYWGLASLKTLAARQAYFLSRLFLSTTLFDCEGRELDLVALLRAEPRSRFEMSIVLGKQAKLPCRFCAFRAPDEVVNRRRQRVNAQAAKQGRRPTKRTLELQGWTLFVTNLPSSKATLEQIGLLYSIRWQIELVFKLWKSHMQLHCQSSQRKERILVELYAKLIGQLLFQFLWSPLRTFDHNLSPTKAFHRFVKKVPRLLDALPSVRRLGSVISTLHKTILRLASREKRKTRLSTCQQLYLEVDYYA